MICFLSTWQICDPCVSRSWNCQDSFNAALCSGSSTPGGFENSCRFETSICRHNCCWKGKLYTQTISLGTRQQKELLLFFIKRINEASCTSFILNMMQHFALNPDATISLLAVFGQFLFQLVFVSNSPPPPQGTQDRRSGPCFSELPRWLWANSASHSMQLLGSLLDSRVS